MTDDFDPLFFIEASRLNAGAEPSETDQQPAADSAREGLLAALNAPQREAALFNDGPLLVIAGPGSGKTRTVTTRFARLVLDGIPPWQILAITFTNKAAGEMRRRIIDMLDAAGRYCPASDLWISTFHSFCARILRREASRIPGLTSGFSIYDEDDAQAVLKQVINDSQVKINGMTPRAVKAFISDCKNAMLRPDDVDETNRKTQTFREMYEEYERRLRQSNALDFDDLLMKTVTLFESDPDALATYADRFHYVMVDEYQDTNECQYRLTNALARARRNICVTGDPDQSIYGWRGADIRNILRFENDYPEATVIRLEENYRSTSHILNAADALIENNAARKPKKLFSQLGDGEKVAIARLADDISEANYISDALKRLQQTDGVPYRHCAVLYRTNRQSEAIEQAFVGRGMPYAIVGGVSFYQRREVKDAVAYLRLIVNPKDDSSFLRVVNVPRRGIGGRSLELLARVASDQSLPLLDAAALPDSDLGVIGSRPRKNFNAFAEQIAGWRKRLDNAPPLADFIQAVIDESGLKSAFDPLADSERLENLYELSAASARFVATHPSATLIDYLENAALLASVDRWDPSIDAVPLMTLHSAKGLEFDVVFVAGCEESLLPLYQEQDAQMGAAIDDKTLEEERRLLFVGMTRARKRLTLTHAGLRRRFNGMTVGMRPSRFLRELPKGSVQRDESKAGDREVFDFDAYLKSRPGRNSTFAVDRDARADATIKERELIESHFADRLADDAMDGIEPDMGALEAQAETDAYDGLDELPVPSVGDKVKHPKFGVGEVTEMSGSGTNSTATVYFYGRGKKKIKVAFGGMLIIRS